VGLKSNDFDVGITVMDTSKVDLNLLVALNVLLAEQNVTKAAQRLNLSQPALSAQLNRLRDLFDDQLFVPTQRGVVPTEFASQLREPLRNALDQLRAVLAHHTQFDPKTSEATFSVAASDYLQYAALIPLALAIEADAPGVRIAWLPVCGKPVEAQMERGEIQLWLRPNNGTATELRSEFLFRERFVCIARQGHPLIDGKLTLDDFTACPHVFVSPGGGGFSGATDVALRRINRLRKVAVSVGSFLVVPELIARSNMIAVVPERIMIGRDDKIQVLPPPLEIDGFDVLMHWHRRNDGHPGLVWLRSLLKGLQARPA